MYWLAYHHMCGIIWYHPAACEWISTLKEWFLLSLYRIQANVSCAESGSFQVGSLASGQVAVESYERVSHRVNSRGIVVVVTTTTLGACFTTTVVVGIAWWTTGLLFKLGNSENTAPGKQTITNAFLYQGIIILTHFFLSVNDKVLLEQSNAYIRIRADWNTDTKFPIFQWPSFKFNHFSPHKTIRAVTVSRINQVIQKPTVSLIICTTLSSWPGQFE